MEAKLFQTKSYEFNAMLVVNGHGCEHLTDGPTLQLHVTVHARIRNTTPWTDEAIGNHLKHRRPKAGVELDRSRQAAPAHLSAMCKNSDPGTTPCFGARVKSEGAYKRRRDIAGVQLA